MSTFSEHEIDWTAEKVQRFWEFQQRNLPDGAWFAHQVGAGVLRFVSHHIKLHGSVLDYGTGRGFLTERLLRLRHCKVTACEFSQDLARDANTRFDTRGNYRGCRVVDRLPLPFADQEFDIAFMLETIEHLPDPLMLSTLKEIERALVPGGVVIITTPNAENPKSSETMCPDCGCVYHRMQHVRSFTRESLAETMSSAGFRIKLCKAINIEAHCSWKNYIYHWIKRRLGSNLPNLVYIGEKLQVPSR